MAGCQEKVPTVRHDMGEMQWKAFGRIIAYAFKIDYFPLYLSPVFLTSCLFGDSEINNKNLLNGFKLYVGMGEKDIIEKNLANLDTKDEDLLDFLDSYGSHSLPKDGSFKELVLEIAHQELVQKPKYIASCFSNTLSKILNKSIGDLNALYKMYKEKDPTPSKIVKALDVQKGLDAKQQKVVTFLIKFIKSLDNKDLRLFLRFVTASDNMSSSIKVRFCKQNMRAPRSRVCVTQLELDDTYQYFNELSEEFYSLLRNPDSFRFSFV